MKIEKSKELFELSKQYIPGGVNSPVRAFKGVGGTPIFMEKAKGAYLYDVDGNSYIDYINSWGPAILGHAPDMVIEALQEQIQKGLSFGTPTELEYQMAKLIHEIYPSMEVIRMVNSGTEATMSAVRVARGYTGRNKIIKFEGCYHGHGDSFLISAGSGALTFGTPDSKGITEGTAIDTLTAPFNDIQSVIDLINANPNQIAAIILEPFVGNMGLIIPQSDFIYGLRKLCDEHKIVLIFDEVMTGFRLSLGGAQQILGIQPDMTTLGKIIGGGLPVGAYGGKKEIMDCVAPKGPVYQAGTLSGNPLALTAGLTLINYLKNNPNVYYQLEAHSWILENEIRNILTNASIPHCIQRIGSMLTVFFTNLQKVNNLTDAKTSDTKIFAKFFHFLLENGVYIPPSQFEAWFVSYSINEPEIQKTLEVIKKFKI